MIMGTNRSFVYNKTHSAGVSAPTILWLRTACISKPPGVGGLTDADGHVNLPCLIGGNTEATFRDLVFALLHDRNSVG